MDMSNHRFWRIGVCQSRANEASHNFYKAKISYLSLQEPEMLAWLPCSVSFVAQSMVLGQEHCRCDGCSTRRPLPREVIDNLEFVAAIQQAERRSCRLWPFSLVDAGLGFCDVR
jgi:hypothetical protein